MDTKQSRAKQGLGCPIDPLASVGLVSVVEYAQDAAKTKDGS